MSKLWLVERLDEVSYDEFDSMVVCAETGEAALKIHPSGRTVSTENWYKEWANPNNLIVKYIGKSEVDIGVVLSSYNAG